MYSPASSYENAPAAAAAVERVDESFRPRLLLYEPSGADRLTIHDELLRAGLRAETMLVGDRQSVDRLDRAAFDVAAVRLAGQRCEELVFAAEFAQVAPWVQFVFWVAEETPSLSAYVARSLGIARLIPVSQVSRWLAAALVPLARLSRAQRAALEAEATIPGVPPVSFRGGAPTVALPEAERQFREGYLRRLLSESPNAKKAAERAGVPYTTLCSMMKKLGLSASPPPREG